jgi:WD40 repeat protein
VAEPSPGTSVSGNGIGRRSPFQGLGFYTEADAKWFFGRVVERKVILAHLRTAPLTVLYAESGVGKSSLLRAGVAPRLRELAVQSIAGDRGPRFFPVVFSAWKDEPVEDLISELEAQLGTFVSATEANGTSGSMSLPRTNLAAAIRAAAGAVDGTLAIILDQFEEHFSYRLAHPEPGRLADELAACINSPDVRANFLIAVREDAYGRLGELFSGRVGNVYNNYLHLDYLTRDAGRDAIEKPVEIYNSEHSGEGAITLDGDLADAVLDEVRRGKLELGLQRPDQNGAGSWAGSGGEEIETPFLQLVMTRLWEHETSHGSRILRKATLDGELGGAETIVRNHVNRALAGLDGQELETATDIFGNLVTPSGAKVAHTADDLAQMTAHPTEMIASVLDRLHDERIVRGVDPAPGTSQPRYEIFHDRLAAPILDWRNRRENARLERARNHAEREAETQRAHARRYRQRARIMFGLALSLLVLLVALVALLQYARHQSANARSERRQATYFGLTTRAQLSLTRRPDVSLLLYLAAYGESPRPVDERSVMATLQAMQSPGAVGILHGHTDSIQSIAFNPAGTILASASADKTVRLWSVSREGHHPLGQPLHAGAPLYSDAFDPSGQILAAGSFNKIILWNIPQHSERASISYDAGAVNSVAFSPTSGWLAAAGSNATVLVWNGAAHRRTILKLPTTKAIRSVAFSPDGKMLAATSGNSVVLWNVATDKPLESLTGPARAIYALAFSPDGKTLAAGGEGRTIVRWDLATHHQISRMVSGLSSVNAIAFSPDGTSLAAGGPGKTLVWNLGSSVPLPLVGEPGDVNSIAFSPNGRILATAGAARTISLWPYPVDRIPYGIPILRHPDKVTSVAFSPQGGLLASGDRDGLIYLSNLQGRDQRSLPVPGDPVQSLAFDPSRPVLAAGYADGSIRLWDVADDRLLGPPMWGTRELAIFSVAFNPAGTTLVSGGQDGAVRLWNVRTHRPLGDPLSGGPGAVYAVAFSPDGREIASAGEGRAIRLWNAIRRVPLEPPLIAQGANGVFSVAFAPQGGLLASGGADDVIHLWNVDGQAYTPVGTLTGHIGYVRSVAFSPDGATLASGSTDNTIRLWDVSTGSALGSLTGNTRSVESVAFSPDGRRLASGSVDHTVRLWQAVRLPASFAALRREVCSFLGAGLSRVEWAEFAPGIPYRQTCPANSPS